jgi:hypothetical protein
MCIDDNHNVEITKHPPTNPTGSTASSMLTNRYDGEMETAKTKKKPSPNSLRLDVGEPGDGGIAVEPGAHGSEDDDADDAEDDGQCALYQIFNKS